MNQRIRLLAVAVFQLTLFALVPSFAHAAARGSTACYPLGNTLGSPLAAPLPKGLYVSEKFKVGSGRGVDANGDRTGSRSLSRSLTATIIWTPGIELFGATYYMRASGLGPVQLDVSVPNGAGRRSDTDRGLADPTIAPIGLSWNLGSGLFVSAEAGVCPPWGSYDKDELANVGNNAWVFEPTFAMTYFGGGFATTAHLTFDVNGRNRATNYRNGTSGQLELSVMKQLKPFSIGPVAYAYSQLGSDDGPVQLDGGRGKSAGLGMAVGYDAGPFSIMGIYVDDIYARSMSDGRQFTLRLNYLFKD
ncbi:transporter [Pseudomonas extremaustralis]|uniref:SphA family protein n=1 Tax=Pseudomonas extremaustralis TaxID=359110 RepID=UPI002857BE62|nr:transporter [Pseudomonas extremaustralis]MDR6575872.1 hypothetical protein [Pseudomonas extremaustralis]